MFAQPQRRVHRSRPLCREKRKALREGAPPSNPVFRAAVLLAVSLSRRFLLAVCVGIPQNQSVQIAFRNAVISAVFSAVFAVKHKQSCFFVFCGQRSVCDSGFTLASRIAAGRTNKDTAIFKLWRRTGLAAGGRQTAAADASRPRAGRPL